MPKIPSLGESQTLIYGLGTTKLAMAGGV